MSFDDRQRLGRYEVLEEIGRGAMGVVYLAQDPLIGRQVAVKVFRVGFSASDDELHNLYARFIREAQSAGILSHPNIVTVHDVAQADGDSPAFIAMEFVQGQTLKEVLDSPEPIPRERAVDLVAQVARALEYAHSMGVVHRDIKPGNILITPDDRVKITDFGIALVNAANITNHGQLLGTPNYMAPEVIEDEEVDHRADLFSLGVVLYELLTRHKPFSGSNMTQVTHRIVYEPFTPLVEYVRDLPAALENVLVRALEKKPERRFQTAHEMAVALEQGRGKETFPNETVEISVAPPRASSPVDTQSVARRRTLRPASRRGLGGWLRRATPVGNVPYWLLAAGIVVGVSMGYFLSRRDVTAQAAVAPAEQVGMAPRPAELEADRARQLASAARRYLAAGDLESARIALGEAVRLLPDSEQIGGELRRVEEQIDLNRTEWVAAVGEHLDASRRSLADGRIRDSTQFASLALELDPMNLEAPELLAQGEAALARIRTRRAATPKLGPVEPVVVAESPRVVERVEPAQPEPEPEPVAVATSGTLNLRLDTRVSPGVLTLYSDADQIFRQRFRFTEKKGFLRSLTSKGGAGELTGEFELAPGDLSLRVYVSFPGEATQTFRLKGELRAGGVRTVIVTIDGAGTAQARLE